MTDKDRKPLFSLAELERVHTAVVKQCDLDDGLRDGIIGDPASCKFDPASLQCRSAGEKNCLTQAQVEALKKTYGGPRTARGEVIYPGRAFPGSELNLAYRELPASQMAATFEIIANEFRYSAFDPAAGPNWQVEDFDFDRDFRRLGVSDSLSAARDPDLRRFKAAGGKLIAYVGYNDIDQADVTIDYYTTVERTMGGRGNTQSFFRLFAIPGMNHCGGGAGADDIDYLNYLEAWLEKGQAPDKMIGAHLDIDEFLKTHDPKSEDFMAAWEAFRSDSKNVQFTRPVYPWPIRAKYLGHGDPNDARSFGPVGASEH
jgi:feruloyl esterase